MKSVACQSVLCILLSLSVFAQSHPKLTSPFKPGGVSSRNMELLDVIPMSTSSEDQFEIATVPYTSGMTTMWKQLIVTTSENSVRLVDVTDPRNSDPEYLYITVKGKVSDAPEASVTMVQIYNDYASPAENTYNGDVFLLVWVGNFYKDKEGGLPVVANTESPVDAKARFIIINLSRAIALCESGSDNHITIHDASVRNVTYDNTVQNNPHIYIGYIPSDYTWMRTGPTTEEAEQLEPHGLNIDHEAAIMTLTPHRRTETTLGQKSFMDVFDLTRLRAISATATYSDSPTAVNRLTMSVSSNDLPIVLPEFSTRVPLGKDVSIQKLSSTSARFVIGSSTNTNTDNTLGEVPNAGGIVIIDLDYSDWNGPKKVDTSVCQ